MKKFIKILLGTVLAVSVFLYWQDNDIVVTKYEYKSEKAPEGFEGFKIAQVSDLQNKMFFKNQSSLIKNLKKTDADIIVITGDLVDANRTNIDNAYTFIDKAVKIAPVYYVSGNHENASGVYEELLEGLKIRGVNILENTYEYIDRNGDKIAIMGIKDIRMNYDFDEVIEDMSNKNEGYFKILLSHRPELYSVYDEKGVDLSFTGHAHGGQIRLPFTDGLFAPNQGAFPKYTSGLRYFDNSAMVISRGLGNSVFPFRIFNRPEITVTTLYSE